MHLPTFTLLIVEDLATHRELYREHLSHDSNCVYQVLEAESVAAGLKLCRSTTIDAILLDYGLPDGDGLAFLAALDTQSNGSSPPVVMLTGMGDERIAVRAMKLGAADYLVKCDLTTALLHSTMRSAIENTRLRLQLRQSEDRFQTAIENTIDCLGIYSAIRDRAGDLIDFRFDYLNAAAMQSNRMTKADMSRTLCEVFPATRETGLLAEYDRVLKTGITLVKEELVYSDVFGDERLTNAYHIQVAKLDDGMVISWRETTAQKQAEQERDRFFDLSPDLLATGNFNGYFVRLNPAFEQVLGFTSAELLARPFIEFVHPDDRDRTIAGAQSLTTGDVVISFENRYLCKDGTYRWLSWNAMPYLEGNLWYAVAHDITDQQAALRERQRQEAALFQSERKFSAIFNQTFQLMGLVSLDGVLLEVNQAALDSIAVPESEIVGKNFWDAPWWHTEQLQQQLREAIATAASGQFVRYEVEFPNPNGGVTITDFSLKPMFDEVGQVESIVAEANDITLGKHAERELKASEEQLQAGIEVAGMGLARFDYATNLVSLSPEAAALYGFAPTQLVVTRAQIHDTFHPDERAELEAVISQVLDPQGTGWFAQDHQVVWPSGEVRCLSVRKQVFFDRSEAVARPSYAILAAIDVTDRKQTQADLEQRNQELDSFVYVVAHDLKAPLRGVANLSEWIEEDLEGSLSVANQQQMALLRSRVNKMQATIDGLLEYARLGIADIGIIESVSIATLLAEVIDLIAPPPTFTIELPPDLPTLSTRRLPLFQVFANLIGNGIKHHDRVDGSIRVSIEDRGDCYEFAIADDGPGIAPEHHDRMFKIFQAVNPQNRADSTGIGLAIVKKIVEAEGGTIWLESKPGKGTTFYFTWLQR